MCLPTAVTGLAKGISPLGAIIDPLNLSGQFVKKELPSVVPTASPEEDQSKAEAKAAQSANAQIAAGNRRRREQQSLMATGAPAAPTATFGDSATADGISPLGGIGGRMSRAVVAQRTASLMSGGAPAPVTGGAPRSGGVSNYKLQMLER